jgi:hypothetical protein
MRVVIKYQKKREGNEDIITLYNDLLKMAITKTQKSLAQLLLNSGVRKDNAIAIGIMLRNREEMMQDLFLWIYDNKPTQEQIMKKAIAMSESLKM